MNKMIVKDKYNIKLEDIVVELSLNTRKGKDFVSEDIKHINGEVQHHNYFVNNPVEKYEQLKLKYDKMFEQQYFKR